MKRRLRLQWASVWALSALLACATARPVGEEEEGEGDGGEVTSFARLCMEPSSVVAFCTEAGCGVYRCREGMKPGVGGRVVRAWAEVEPLSEVGGGAQRYWGSAQEWPWESRPVFIIPWDHKPPLLPSQQKELEEAARERAKPHERHHIFPQAFREWFARQGIDIDEYVMPLLVEKHRSIHRGANGGPWNDAWLSFIRDHAEEPVSREEIYRYAGQLIYQFELFGPVVPYWKQPPPLPPGY